MKLRLPWELTTIYTENLRALISEDAEEDDEEDIEAQEASQQRLRVRAGPCLWCYCLHLLRVFICAFRKLTRRPEE
jgi:hypothetical protein